MHIVSDFLPALMEGCRKEKTKQSFAILVFIKVSEYPHWNNRTPGCSSPQDMFAKAFLSFFRPMIIVPVKSYRNRSQRNVNQTVPRLGAGGVGRDRAGQQMQNPII